MENKSMINNIDEYKKAKEVVKILEEKIGENKSLIDEKNKSINETFNSFFNPKDASSMDMNGTQMINSINYDRSINNMANRQLNRYLMMVKKPYFGRVDFKDNKEMNSHYFGIETLIKDNDVVINDWRSPIANLYYEGLIGNASYESPGGTVNGDITLKRQYQFVDGELKHFVDTGLNINDELLIEALGKNDDVVMKNIVNTIQKEQNKAIRYLGDDDLLVLGVAGSGKTSIALHRIAYLVYKDSIKYEANKVCFITPNEVFFRYIDNVLPELGEDNVVNMTMNEVARTIMKMELYKNKLRVENKIDYLEKVINGKKEFDCDSFFASLNEFLDKKMNDLFVPKMGLKIGGLTFSSELFKELYFNKFKRRNYSQRKRFIKEYLKDRASNEKKVTKSVLDLIDTFVNKLLPEINVFEVYSEFLKSINYEGEVIHRNVVGYEHIFPLCYIKVFFRGCKLFDKFNHLLIDEYQDLNVIERNVIKNVFLCNKTLVGDLNQKLFLQDYDGLKEEFKLVELNNSYRSTLEIFEFLETIINSKGVNGVKRHGNKVSFKLFNSESEEKKYIKNIVEEYEGKSLAIICKNKKQASKLYLELSDLDNVSFLDIKSKSVTRGVVVSSVSLIKGLEFDKVLVYDSSSKNYSSDIDRNYFYIACSRAINDLEVISCGDFTRFIDKKYIEN